MNTLPTGSSAGRKALTLGQTLGSGLLSTSTSTARCMWSIQLASLYATTRLSMSSLLWLAGEVDTILSTCKSSAPEAQLWKYSPGDTTRRQILSDLSSEDC
jgi:hypothetical protein